LARIIGLSTGKKQKARLALKDSVSNNCFLEFLEYQSKCKVVITAQPTHCDGDNRTWEAMASGALVVMDTMYNPIEPPFENKKHCLIYDATKVQDIERVLDEIGWYLKNDTAREKIAKSGYEFVKKFHRPINRVQYMLKEHLKRINSEPNILFL
jgi:spore maturation protein CgeB